MVLVFWHLHVSQIYSLSFNEWHWAAKTRELSSLGSGRTTTVIDTKAKRRQPWHYSPLAVDIESPLTGVLSSGLWHQIGHCRLTKIFTGSSTSPPPPQFVSKVKAIFQNWSRPQHSEVKWPFFFLHSSPSILLSFYDTSPAILKSICYTFHETAFAPKAVPFIPLPGTSTANCSHQQALRHLHHIDALLTPCIQTRECQPGTVHVVSMGLKPPVAVVSLTNAERPLVNLHM